MVNRVGYPRPGFTLVDLTITVLILGILATVAAPKLANSQNRFQAETVAYRVAGDLRYARRHAKRIGGKQVVSFAVATDRFELLGVDHWNHPGSPYIVDLNQGPTPAMLISAAFGAAGNLLEFDHYGRPANAGTVVIETQGIQKTILVNGVTGEVTIQP